MKTALETRLGELRVSLIQSKWQDTREAWWLLMGIRTMETRRTELLDELQFLQGILDNRNDDLPWGM